MGPPAGETSGGSDAAALPDDGLDDDLAFVGMLTEGLGAGMPQLQSPLQWLEMNQ